MTRLAPLMCVLVLGSASSRARSQDVATDSKLHDVVRQMFEAGLGPRRSPAKAQSLFDQAKRLSPADPRITYAWGLLQYRRMKRDDAMELFADAADSGDATYFRPRQTTAWLLISSTRNRERGLAEAVKLAQQIAAATDPKVIKPRVAATRWLGEVLTAARLTTAGSIREIEATEKQVVGILAEAGLAEEFAIGRLAAEDRHVAAIEGRKTEAREAARKAEAESKAAIARIETRLKTIDGDSADTEAGKTDLRANFEEIMSRIAAELGRLDKDYQFLDDQAEQVQEHIDTVLKEMTALKALGTGRRRPGRNTGAELAFARLQQELGMQQTRYLQLANAAQGIVSQATNLMAYRARVVRDYEQRTGQIVQQQKRMNLWSARLKKRRTRISDTQAAAKKTPKAPKRVTFRALMPLNLSTEQKALLATFNPAKGDEE